MKTKLFSLFAFIFFASCSGGVDYSEKHINETSGRYLYNQDDVLDVYYKNNELFLKWRGAENIKPVALDENTFFVADMYNKLRFLVQSESNKRYIGIISKENEDSITYDYEKVADNYKTPGMHLKDKEYTQAYQGYLAIKKQDSTSEYVSEWTFNRIGYKLLRDKNYKDAIEVFKMNVSLYPDSDNAYDSLADAYVLTGDSLQAYNNYTKALELNTGNRSAKRFIKAYNKD